MGFILKIKRNGIITKEIAALEGENVLEILKKNKIYVNSGCGGCGICGKCNITFQEGTLIKQSTGEILFVTNNKPIIIKSCHYSVPQKGYAAILIEGGENNSTKYVRSFDSENVLSFFKDDKRIRKGSYLPCCKGKFAIIIDIGTTNVSGALIDFFTGKTLCGDTLLNKQSFFSSDVISRIRLCSENIENVKILHSLIVSETIIPLIKRLLGQGNYDVDNLRRIVLSGNTAMLHLVLGLDPSGMGKYPFTPLFLESKTMFFKELMRGCVDYKDTALEKIETVFLPSISAFIGADISSGIYAMELYKRHENILLIDIGTNGEIVLKAKDKLYACSTAAGPVFEGFGLSSGINAAAGAIKNIIFREKTIRVFTIEGLKAIGICGTGYISFLAEAWKNGLIDSLGRFNKDVMPRYHINFNENDRSIDLTGTGVLITEEDISKLIQAKSAIASGIEILLKEAGVAAKDVAIVYLAGTFGMEMRSVHAVHSGLLKDFLPKQIRSVGNLSLAGAYLSLFDESSVAEMKDYKNKVTVINLNEISAFSDIFINNLYFQDKN